MTQNEQKLIVPANRVYLNVFRGSVIKSEDGKAYIQRLVCAKFNGVFYIHSIPHQTEVGSEGFSFFMPKADTEAQAFIDKIRAYGQVNLSSEHWIQTDEKAFKAGLEEHLHAEYELKYEHDRLTKKAA